MTTGEPDAGDGAAARHSHSHGLARRVPALPCDRHRADRDPPARAPRSGSTTWSTTRRRCSRTSSPGRSPPGRSSPPATTSGPTNLPFLTTRLEMKMPLYGFSTVPFQAVLGPSTLAVRLPAVLFGTAATALLFWVTRVIGRRRVEALAAAAVFATAPWAVHLGRVGWEPAAVLPFTIGGAALLVSGLWHDRPWRVVAAAAVLAVGAYAYQPALLQHVLLAGRAHPDLRRRLNRRLGRGPRGRRRRRARAPRPVPAGVPQPAVRAAHRRRLGVQGRVDARGVQPGLAQLLGASGTRCTCSSSPATSRGTAPGWAC